MAAIARQQRSQAAKRDICLTLPRPHDLVCDDSGFRRVALSVHADPREASTQQAGQLSQARAEYISRLVVSLGVPASNICMRAQGARQPVAEPPSPKNIRVEMVVSCLNPQRPFCE